MSNENLKDVEVVETVGVGVKSEEDSVKEAKAARKAKAKETIMASQKEKLLAEVAKVVEPDKRKSILKNYRFGAGGFKLGERVEIRSTGARGVLIGEIVHMTGCNTYQVQQPKNCPDGKPKISNIDYNILRRLEDWETMVGNFDGEPLEDDEYFSPKGIDVNGQWIMDSLLDGLEFLPEIDDAIGVEEITIAPGSEVYNKVCGMPMLVNYVHRTIYSKELEYGLTFNVKDKTQAVASCAYGLIPLRQQIDVYGMVGGKPGALFDDFKFGPEDTLSGEDLGRYYN